MESIEHGLLVGVAPPSIDVLSTWLDEQGVERTSAVEVVPMVEGKGWRVVATRNLEVGETICKIPKTAILSCRTASLPAISEPSSATTSHTILGLALALLHELRLGSDSRFWGYLQSLPREIVPVPALWPLAPLDSDARRAIPWLQGTEAARDLQKREKEGVGLDQAREFYEATISYLPPTRLHPSPSPFEAFAHACSVVSTRAFVIDLYHTVALCPFADMLNHTATSHTSLASDDFVCHHCGSLTACDHDIIHPHSTTGIPLRLEHLSETEWTRIQSDPDTVDMYVELPVRQGQEVMNSYGEGIGEARLLVEWGFVPGSWPRDEHQEEDEEETENLEENYAGDGVTWDLEDLVSPDIADAWLSMGEVDDASLHLFPTDVPDTEDETTLICAPKEGVYHLNYAGQVSLRLFAALYLASATAVGKGEDAALELELISDVNHLEATWAQDQAGEQVPPLRRLLRSTAEAVRDLLKRRLEGMYRPELAVGRLYDICEALPRDAQLQAMAMTVLINEKALLQSALDRWEELLESTEERDD